MPSNFYIYNDQLDISSIEKEQFSVLFGDICKGSLTEMRETAESMEWSCSFLVGLIFEDYVFLPHISKHRKDH